MIEDESSVDPKSVAHRDQFEIAVLYDFAKFITTLALLAIGGVLTVTQTADSGVAKPPVIAFVVGAIALGGVSALSAASKLAKVAPDREMKSLTPKRMIDIAMALIGIGVGGFMTVWWKTL